MRSGASATRADRRVVRVHRTAAGVARWPGARGPVGAPPAARDPDVEAAVRAWLRAVLAAAEAAG